MSRWGKRLGTVLAVVGVIFAVWSQVNLQLVSVASVPGKFARRADGDTVNIYGAASHLARRVRFRLNGGAWTNVITAGSATGTFSATATDTIELRHAADDGAQENFVELVFSGSVVGYGVFLS